MSTVQASTSCVSFVLFAGHSPSRHRSSLFMPSSTADWITATVCLPRWVTSWSVSFNQFYERQHGWFSRRRSTTTSPMTFETSYTGFRFGSEFRLNFVCSFSRCLRGEAPPYLTEMLSLVSSSDALRSHRSAARGDLIIPRTFTKTFGPRGFAVSGPTAWNSLPAYLKDKDLSPAIFRSKLKTHFFSS